MWVFIFILLVIIGGIIFFGNKFTNLVILPPKHPIDKAIKRETEQNHIMPGYYEGLEKDDFKLITDDGYNLICQLIKNPIPSEKYIILCHGFGFNRIGGLKYVDIFLAEGFNVVLYDHRNSGESEGFYTTMGYLEKEDLKKVIDYICNRFGKDILIGTHGESMGAASVLLHCAEDSRVDFVIADCPYSDLKDQLAYRLKIEHKLPRFPFMHIASIFSKIRAGFYFGQVSPIQVIKDNNGLPDLPIMFVHGDADAYIPMEMSEEMYQVKKGYKKLYLAKGADHALAVSVDREKYAREVHDFLEGALQ